MPNTNSTILIVTFALFGLTLATRWLPFCMKKVFEKSDTLQRVGLSLPGTITMLLTLHTLEDTSWNTAPYGLPELICLGVALLLFYWRKSLLIAISLSMGLYLVTLFFFQTP